MLLFDILNNFTYFTFQNIRKIDGGNGPARFRVMMSDGRHTLSCMFFFNLTY